MRILITGSAGFIGSNLAHAWLKHGHTITVYGYLSQLGSARNLEWLRASAGDALQIICGGHANSLSIWAEFPPILSRLAGRTITPANTCSWRPGDQPVFEERG